MMSQLRLQCPLNLACDVHSQCRDVCLWCRWQCILAMSQMNAGNIHSRWQTCDTQFQCEIDPGLPGYSHHSEIKQINFTQSWKWSRLALYGPMPCSMHVIQKTISTTHVESQVMINSWIRNKNRSFQDLWNTQINTVKHRPTIALKPPLPFSLPPLPSSNNTLIVYWRG